MIMIRLDQSTGMQRFLFALSKTPRLWVVNHNGTIRQGQHCPLSYVADPHNPLGTNKAQALFGIDGVYLGHVCETVDNDKGVIDVELRQQLLAACGVGEP